MLYQHLKLKAQSRGLDADKARSWGILSCFLLLTGERSLEIDEVYAEKIKVKVSQQNFVSQYINID